MNSMREEYARKRAEAIRELASLKYKLYSKGCTVETINRAYLLKIKYNL